jgi:titin
MGPTTVSAVNGDLVASGTFNVSTHAFTGTVYVSNFESTIDPQPPYPGYAMSGHYDCVEHSISGTVGSSGFTFTASMGPDNTQLSGGPWLLGFPGPNGPWYTDVVWGGGLTVPLVEDTGTDVTTDPDDEGATAEHPEQVDVHSPTPGDFSIATTDAPNLAVGGYYLLAPTMLISAPNATAGNPLTLTFTIDASLLDGRAPVLFRNTVPVPACATQPSTTASPDPCVSTQAQLPNGDWEVVVLSSHASAWSVGVAAHAPGAPRVTAAAPGNKRAKVSWAAPASDGGAPVTSYLVTAYLGGAAKSSAIFGSKARSGVLTLLSNGKQYTFKARATNLMGNGPRSKAGGAVRVGAPKAPTAVLVKKVAAGTLRVSFKPSVANGAPVTGYSASCKPSGGAATSATATASPVSVGGLVAGRKYTCRVRGTNSRGTGPWSKASAAVRA